LLFGVLPTDNKFNTIYLSDEEALDKQDEREKQIGYGKNNNTHQIIHE